MAALSTTTATIHISGQSFPTSPIALPRQSLNWFVSSSSVVLASQTRKLLTVKSSSSGFEAAAETTATEVGESESTESSIEAPKGPPSLISALNVERALRGIPITDVDYYSILGIPRGCSYEQVTVGYRNKVSELLSQGLDGEELSNKMEILKESYAILSSEEERRMYDWSLARSGKPDRYTWPFEVDKTKLSTEPPPAQEPEDVGPTRMVGYFMVGWIILSFALSIALNR